MTGCPARVLTLGGALANFFILNGTLSSACFQKTHKRLDEGKWRQKGGGGGGRKEIHLLQCCRCQGMPFGCLGEIGLYLQSGQEDKVALGRSE